MSHFPLSRITDFISNVVPFDTLDDDEINRVVSSMEIAYFPRETTIIQAGGDPAENLYVIHSGSVKVGIQTDTGEEILVDVRGEGDVFGAVSVLSSKKALFSVVAREDVLTFLLPADQFKRLVDEYPNFQRYFTYSLARNIQSARQTAEARLTQLVKTESVADLTLQMRSRVTRVMSNDLLTCRPEISIRQAAQEMTQRGVGSIIVVSEPGRPIGILTDTDLRKRVLASGIDPETLVMGVMSQPPLTISHQAFAFEAMLDMTRHGVHHLLVTEGEHMVGIVSDHDLKIITGSSPVGLVKEIDHVSSLSDMERFPERIRRVMEMMLRWGCSAEYMMDLMTEMVDRLTLKLFSITEHTMEQEGLGSTPADYIWLALDASGRKEQAPPTCQSHALVFGDVSLEKDPIVREWFLGFARRVSEGLVLCGRPFCPSGLMAKEPHCCMSATSWGRTFINWLEASSLDDFSENKVFFDFRPIMGEAVFAVTLKKDIWNAIDGSDAFPRRLAQVGAGETSPLGFLRQSVVERDGRYTDHVDLTRLLDPIIGGARALAWHYRVGETNTLGRLSELALLKAIPEHMAADLREVFSFLTMMHVSRYLEPHDAGVRPIHQVQPSSLDSTQRKMLKESFSVIADFRERYLTRYAKDHQTG